MGARLRRQGSQQGTVFLWNLFEGWRQSGVFVRGTPTAIRAGAPPVPSVVSVARLTSLDTAIWTRFRFDWRSDCKALSVFDHGFQLFLAPELLRQKSQHCGLCAILYQAPWPPWGAISSLASPLV